MKITIFANGVSDGGAEHVACNLANHFVTNGYEVDLLTMADDEPTYGINNDVTRIPLLYKYERKGFLYNLVRRYRRFKEYIRSSKTDCYIAFFWIAAIMLNAARKKAGVPVITSERTNPYTYSWYYKALLKYYAPNADLNVFQTSGQRNFYGTRIKDSRCKVIPNAVETQTEPLKWEDREDIIVSTGRLNKVKNYPMLIKAYSRLGKEAKNYKLIIYGAGSERKKLEKMIKELNLEEQVKLAGRKNNIEEYVSRCKIFVLTSLYEGMPNALMEAMSLGLACVSTDCPTGGPKDLIKPEYNGILISTENVDQLTDVLRRLINDELSAKMMGINATRVREKFSTEIIYRQWEECVKTCVKKYEKGRNNK